MNSDQSKSQDSPVNLWKKIAKPQLELFAKELNSGFSCVKMSS